MTRCSRCGEHNDDGVRYCGTCGLPVPNPGGIEPAIADGAAPNDETVQGEQGRRSSEYVDAPSFGETGTVSAPSPSSAAVTGSATVASSLDATLLGASSTSSEAPPSGPPPPGPVATGTPAAPLGPEVRSTRSTSLMIAALAVAAAVVIIGGVFVLLVSGSGENEVARPGQDSVASATAAPDAPIPSEAPPVESLPAVTAPAETAGPSEPAVTVAPTAPVRAPGDLGLDQPILDESCDGRYITFVGSAVGDRPYNVVVSELLDLYSGANYIWTRACPSLRQEFTDGAEIYGVVFGPYATEQEACDARVFGPEDAYVRRISTFDPQDHTIGC